LLRKRLQRDTLDALRVVVVLSLAGRARLALGSASVTLTTTLLPLLDTAAGGAAGGGGSRSGGGLDNSGHGSGSDGGGGDRDLGRGAGANLGGRLGGSRRGRSRRGGSRAGRSTTPDSRARGLVVDRNGVVDAQLEAVLVASVDTGDFDGRGRLSSRATRNLNLSARDVELGTTKGRGAVETDMLNTEEVLASGGILGEVEGDLAEVVGLESKTVVVTSLVGT
jgi:hypothetical protein